MTARSELNTVFEALKAHLKSKRITYAELANRTHMSEANVKRIFSNQSCSLEQIVEMCSATGASFLDLISVANRRKAPTFKLDSEAEEYFLTHFDCFIFYRNLLACNDLQKFLSENHFSKSRVEGYLKELLNLNLVKKSDAGFDRVGIGYLDLSQCPRLTDRIKNEWVPWFFNKILDSDESRKYSIQFASTGLTEKHGQQLMEEVKNLLDRYKEIGFDDQRTSSEFDPVGICIGIGPHRVGVFEQS